MHAELEPALRSFHEHGYARLGVRFDPALTQRLAARAEDLMLGRVTHEGLFFQKDTDTGRYDDLQFGKGYQGPSLNYRKIEKLEKDPLYLEQIQNPLYEQIARAIIAGPIAIYRAVLFSKAARGGTPLPFHQDAGKFWGLDRDPPLQIWLALDDAPLDAGALEVVPGSHLGGLATPLGGLVPETLVQAKEAEARAVALPARAGEVILVHNYLWHRSGANTTDRPRRAFSVCYMSAETKCLRKKRAPRAFLRIFA